MRKGRLRKRKEEKGERVGEGDEREEGDGEEEKEGIKKKRK